MEKPNKKKQGHLNLGDVFAYGKRAENGCIEWQRAILNNGYGQLSANGKSQLVHRYVFSLIHGEQPMERFVMHICDNRKCFNPDHLKWGTHSENMLDMYDKKRAGGEKHHKAKLKEHEVKQMRELYAHGVYNMTELGAIYGVTKGTAKNIIRMKNWKRV